MRRLRDLAHAQTLTDPPVRAVDGLEGEDERGQCDHDEPGAVVELGGGDDDRGDAGQKGAEAVEEGFAPLPGGPPVQDHAGLGDREADEDTDREERHQGVGVTSGEDQQRRRDHREPHHPVPVHLSVGLQTEDVRHVVVPGQQLEQDGQPAEGGVGRQRKQHHGRELNDVEGPVVTEGGVGELGEDGDALHRLEPETGDQHGQTDQHHAQQPSQRHLRTHRPAGGRRTEGRHRVGYRLHTGQCGAAGGERLEQEQGTDGGGVVCENGGVSVGGRGGDGRVAEQADGDHDEDRADEDGGRDDEGAGRVDDPAQIHSRDEHQDTQTDHQPVAVQAREGGRQRGHAGGDGDGDVQHVVEDQRTGRDQARTPSQVRLRHGIGATAVRERRDDLAVRGHQHRQQPRDGQRHGQREPKPVPTCGRKYEHDGLGPVRHRRHRVQGQGSEPGDSGQLVPGAGIGRFLGTGCGVLLGGQGGHVGGLLRIGLRSASARLPDLSALLGAFLAPPRPPLTAF